MSLPNVTSFIDSTWGLGLALMPFILLLSGMGLIVQTASQKNYLDFTSALARSKCLAFAISLWGTNTLHSRVSVIATLCGTVIYPTFFTKRGLLDPEDMKRLPVNMKLKMRIASWLLITGFLWLLSAATFIELNK